MSEYHTIQARKLLGHIIRAGTEDPMHNALFKNEGLERIELPYRRVGKPRAKWMDEIVNRYVREKFEEDEIGTFNFDWNDDDFRDALKADAKNYEL